MTSYAHAPNSLGVSTRRRKSARPLRTVGIAAFRNRDNVDPLGLAKVGEIRGFVRHAALAKDLCDRIMPFRLLRASLGYRDAQLTQMSTAQVIRKIRCGQAQD